MNKAALNIHVQFSKCTFYFLLRYMAESIYLGCLINPFLVLKGIVNGEVGREEGSGWGACDFKKKKKLKKKKKK